MNEELKQKAATPNDYLANERTYLSWVRTGLGIMAFGFVVVKFSLFVKQIYVLIGKEHVGIDHETNGYSGILGIVLVGAGLCTALFSYFSYRSNITKLDKGDFHYSSLMITTLTVFLSFVGILILLYLIKTA
ncbi:MAG: hypothetical protein K0R51_1306 [Cytophagaceae bacterium]|jgi:putative membrane protein|nr:hypothetical protein [Cytophagaceae bacterium]